MLKNLLFCGALLIMALLSGCCSQEEKRMEQFGEDSPRKTITVFRTNETIKLDGRLDEKIWSLASAYPFEKPALGGSLKMTPPKTARTYRNSAAPFEPGTVRLLCNDKYLYIGAVLTDSDVVQYGDRDQALFYETGDIVEIFIKSEKHPAYHEIFITPNNKRTTFFFEARGYVRRNLKKLNPEFIGAAEVHGTLNYFKDKDKGWSVEAAIPLKVLEEPGGIKFDSNGKWTIMIGRYNYNYNVCDTNGRNYILSTVPQLPQANFHLHEYYGAIKFYH